MIEYIREQQNIIPSSLVKIIGLGGAGANMLDRVSLEGIEGAEMLALNSDVRTLNNSVVRERIQLGRTLTKGLATGGDPELGQKVMLEAENEVRAAIKGRKIVFLCVGLGGGTGSGGAPILTRIAREEGAFVVVFATMPFIFEGRRRREQAETALNELAVLSNALVTFDNNRMGELVLAKQGIHEAFTAGDRMISDSIKAVIRLVIRPGLIHVGLDDLMTALRTTRSRCLFGSGVANGKDRATKALTNALASPLLDKGTLLRDASSVLVHICGGEDLTLHEVNLLMEKLSKFVPTKAHVLFGAAIDANMSENLSITLISALPEDKLQESSTNMDELSPSIGFDFAKPIPQESSPIPADEPIAPSESATIESPTSPFEDISPENNPFAESSPVFSNESPAPLTQKVPQSINDTSDLDTSDLDASPQAPPRFSPPRLEVPAPEEASPSLSPFNSRGTERWAEQRHTAVVRLEPSIDSPFAEGTEASKNEETPLSQAASAAKELRDAVAITHEGINQSNPSSDFGDLFKQTREKNSKSEELFQSDQRGRFADTAPNYIDGEDLDVPAFLRKKKG